MGTKQSQKTKSDQTTTVAPPTWTMPGIQDASARVTAALNQLPTTRYEGPMMALPGEGAVRGIADGYREVASEADALGLFVRDQLPGVLANPTFSSGLPTSRFQLAPAQQLDSVISASINPVFRELTERVLPGIRSSAIESGAYSGDRAMGVVPGQAIREASEGASRIAAQIGYEDYNNRENRRLQAFGMDEDRALAGYQADTARTLGAGDLLSQRFGMLPDLIDTAMRMSSSGVDLSRTALDMETARAQSEIDATLAREQYDFARPFMGLDFASDLLARLSGNYGTTNNVGTQTTVQKIGGLGPVVQAIAGMAAAAGSMAMGMPPGAMGGGGGGALGAASAQPTSTMYQRAPYGSGSYLPRTIR